MLKLAPYPSFTFNTWNSVYSFYYIKHVKIMKNCFLFLVFWLMEMCTTTPSLLLSLAYLNCEKWEVL